VGRGARINTVKKIEKGGGCMTPPLPSSYGGAGPWEARKSQGSAWDDHQSYFS